MNHQPFLYSSTMRRERAPYQTLDFLVTGFVKDVEGKCFFLIFEVFKFAPEVWCL